MVNMIKKLIQTMEMDSSCFACGHENSRGLGLSFFLEANITKAYFCLSKDYQGFKGIVHGGVLATILDSVMLNNLFSLGIKAVTVKMDIRYRLPVCIDNGYMAEGFLKKVQGKFCVLNGRIIEPQNKKIYASSTAIFRKIDEGNN